MLRAFLLYLSQANWAKNVVTKMGVARRVAGRFVAGETEADAVRVVRELNAKGITATCDVLGESVTNASMAQDAVDQYLRLMECLAKEKLNTSVSLKLTALGFDIDENLCRRNMHTLLKAARDVGMEVTIDMESS